MAANRRREAIIQVIMLLRKLKNTNFTKTSWNFTSPSNQALTNFRNALKTLHDFIRVNVPPGTIRGAALMQIGTALKAVGNVEKVNNNAAARQGKRAEARAALEEQREAFIAARPKIGAALTGAAKALEKVSVLGPKARMNRWYTDATINAPVKKRSIAAYKIAAKLNGNTQNHEVVASMRRALSGSANQKKLLHKYLVYPIGLAAYPKSDSNYVAGLEKMYASAAATALQTAETKSRANELSKKFINNYATALPSRKRQIVNAYLNAGRNIEKNKINMQTKPVIFWGDVNAAYATRKRAFIPQDKSVANAAKAYRGTNINKNKKLYQNNDLKKFWQTVNNRLNHVRQLEKFSGALTRDNLGNFKSNYSGLKWALEKVGTEPVKRNEILALAQGQAGGGGNGKS
jgi:hypothetical protein